MTRLVVVVALIVAVPATLAAGPSNRFFSTWGGVAWSATDYSGSTNKNSDLTFGVYALPGVGYSRVIGESFELGGLFRFSFGKETTKSNGSETSVDSRGIGFDLFVDYNVAKFTWGWFYVGAKGGYLTAKAKDDTGTEASVNRWDIAPKTGLKIFLNDNVSVDIETLFSYGGGTRSAKGAADSDFDNMSFMLAAGFSGWF